MPKDNLEKNMEAEEIYGEKNGNAAGEENGSEADINDIVCAVARESEIEDLKNQLAAVRADLFNFRQRTERERAKSRKLIAEDKIAEFLPVLDNLDRALSVPENGTAKDVLIGVRMVQRQFLSVLESSEVTIIPAEGCPFDPMLHDAVETEFVETPEQNGLVLCELMRGYRTPERVLRAAQVRVGRLKN